jgi:hypothetical protein
MRALIHRAAQARAQSVRNSLLIHLARRRLCRLQLPAHAEDAREALQALSQLHKTHIDKYRAELMAAHGIHVLVSLNGHTADNRNGIRARLHRIQRGGLHGQGGVSTGTSRVLHGAVAVHAALLPGQLLSSAKEISVSLSLLGEQHQMESIPTFHLCRNRK